MSTFTQIYYHVVFSTKERRPVLDEANRADLFRYVWGIVKNKKCHLYRINGVENHVHIFSSLHPTVCLADFVKDIKVSTALWIKERRVFPNFDHWQDGYGAFTASLKEKNGLIEYIKGQQEHHKKVSFVDEYRKLLQEAGIKFDEKFLVNNW
jgi:putative transposase